MLSRDGSANWASIGAGLVGLDYSSVDWGDYDNDGDLDLATANYDHSTVSININQNSPSGVNDPEEIPAVTRLQPNYPNPFNPRTTLTFDLAQPTQHVHMAVFDLQGSLVATLVNKSMEAGRH